MTLTSWPDIVQAIASVLNVLFVIGIFIFEKHENKTAQKKEKREYWYREIVLNRCMSGIDAIFSKLDEDLHSTEEICQKATASKDDTELRGSIQKIQKDIISLKRIFDASIPLFDKKLNKKLKMISETLEDSLIEGIEMCFLVNDSFDSLFQKATTHKMEICSLLYQFDMTILDEN